MVVVVVQRYTPGARAYEHRHMKARKRPLGFENFTTGYKLRHTINCVYYILYRFYRIVQDLLCHSMTISHVVQLFYCNLYNKLYVIF